MYSASYSNTRSTVPQKIAILFYSTKRMRHNMNAIPLYEAKNKLPLFMHQAESLGPVFISPAIQEISELKIENWFE